MEIVSGIWQAARERVVCPIVGRLVDRSFRWVHCQDEWNRIMSFVALSAIETASIAHVRSRIATLTEQIGPYLSVESHEVLWLIDEIARINGPNTEAN